MAFLELTWMLVAEPRTSVLLVLLLIAAVTDYRTFKIPNWLTAGGLAFALIYNFVAPQYNAAWNFAPFGMLIGLLVTLPLYALKTMGAGDVKLMAMVGAFLGPVGVLHALLYSFITAGIAALAFASAHGAMRRMLGNLVEIARGMMWSTVAGNGPTARVGKSGSVGTLAFGISIALGTWLYVINTHYNFY